MSDKILLIGTTDGALRAERTGREFRVSPFGLEQFGGMRCPIVVDCSDPNTLYAGTMSSGVQRSRDGGRSWQAINDGLTKPEIWWLTQHPKTGDLWAGVSPAAIFKSTWDSELK